jgi:hypothetical protein
MFNARNSTPLPPAIAAGTVLRARGSPVSTWQLHMPHPTVSTPIYRGVTR